MLVLSRKQREELVIDGAIRVKILGVNGNKVRIGIEAPPEVPIVRAELRARDAIIPKSIEVKKRDYHGRKMPAVPTSTSA